MSKEKKKKWLNRRYTSSAHKTDGCEAITKQRKEDTFAEETVTSGHGFACMQENGSGPLKKKNEERNADFVEIRNGDFGLEIASCMQEIATH